MKKKKNSEFDKEEIKDALQDVEEEMQDKEGEEPDKPEADYREQGYEKEWR